MDLFITISHTLRRNFWWYNNDLWLETVPEHIGVVVGLATGDEINNPKALEEYVGICRAARLRKRERASSSAATQDAVLVQGRLLQRARHRLRQAQCRFG